MDRSVSTTLQADNLKYRLQDEANSHDAHGPEEGSVEVVVKNVSFQTSSAGGLLLKFCCVNDLRVVKGKLPERIADVTVDREVIWTGDVDEYVDAKLTLSLNGHSHVTKAVPASRMQTVAVPLHGRTKDDTLSRGWLEAMLRK